MEHAEHTRAAGAEKPCVCMCAGHEVLPGHSGEALAPLADLGNQVASQITSGVNQLTGGKLG